MGVVLVKHTAIAVSLLLVLTTCVSRSRYPALSPHVSNLPAVVQFICPVTGSSGSGIIIESGERTIILTVAHLFRASDVTVVRVFAFDREGSFAQHVGRCITKDTDVDLALVSIDVGGLYCAYLAAKEQADNIKIGEPLQLMSCPAGMHPRSHDGRLASFSAHPFTGLWGFAGQAFFGSSGGGVFYQGRLLGILSQGIMAGQLAECSGHFIPYDTIRNFLDNQGLRR